MAYTAKGMANLFDYHGFTVHELLGDGPKTPIRFSPVVAPKFSELEACRIQIALWDAVDQGLLPNQSIEDYWRIFG